MRLPFGYELVKRTSAGKCVLSIHMKTYAPGTSLLDALRQAAKDEGVRRWA